MDAGRIASGEGVLFRKASKIYPDGTEAVELAGTPEEIQTAPKNDFVRNFLGEERFSRM